MQIRVHPPCIPLLPSAKPDENKAFDFRLLLGCTPPVVGLGAPSHMDDLLDEVLGSDDSELGDYSESDSDDGAGCAPAGDMVGSSVAAGNSCVHPHPKGAAVEDGEVPRPSSVHARAGRVRAGSVGDDTKAGGSLESGTGMASGKERQKAGLKELLARRQQRRSAASKYARHGAGGPIVAPPRMASQRQPGAPDAIRLVPGSPAWHQHQHQHQQRLCQQLQHTVPGGRQSFGHHLGAPPSARAMGFPNNFLSYPNSYPRHLHPHHSLPPRGQWGGANHPGPLAERPSRPAGKDLLWWQNVRPKLSARGGVGSGIAELSRFAKEQPGTAHDVAGRATLVPPPGLSRLLPPGQQGPPGVAQQVPGMSSLVCVRVRVRVFVCVSACP